MLYSRIIKPLIFRLSAEGAHLLILRLLGIVRRIPLAGSIVRWRYSYKPRKSQNVNLFGIDFPNPVGLAAGLDSNAEYADELGWFGFSFVEVGSITPQPQSGNPRPRMFSLRSDKALVNRIGMDNKGVLNAIEHLKKRNPKTIVSANIAKNHTSMSDAEIQNDYMRAFSLLYDFVDMFTINISFNDATEGLQNLQEADFLSEIIDPLLDIRICNETYKPILVKISPDIPDDELDDILRYCMMSGIDGIVACNSTTSREGLTASQERLEKIGEGNVSGAPLFQRSLAKVKHINEFTKGHLPIIGVGGIMTPEQAKEMLDAGASLIELMTGLIYEGPTLVRKILKHLDS